VIFIRNPKLADGWLLVPDLQKACLAIDGSDKKSLASLDLFTQMISASSLSGREDRRLPYNFRGNVGLLTLGALVAVFIVWFYPFVVVPFLATAPSRHQDPSGDKIYSTVELRPLALNTYDGASHKDEIVQTTTAEPPERIRWKRRTVQMFFNVGLTGAMFTYLAFFVQLRREFRDMLGDEWQDDEWGFGQLLAVFTWIPSMIDWVIFVPLTPIGKFLYIISLDWFTNKLNSPQVLKKRLRGTYMGEGVKIYLAEICDTILRTIRNELLGKTNSGMPCCQIQGIKR